MLAMIRKASDDYWYQFKEVNNIKELLDISKRHSLIVKRQTFCKDDVEFWEGFKKEDIPKLTKAELEVTIYDDWVE